MSRLSGKLLISGTVAFWRLILRAWGGGVDRIWWRLRGRPALFRLQRHSHKYIGALIWQWWKLCGVNMAKAY